MEATVKLPVPATWRKADTLYAGALERARTAVTDPRTMERLSRYYSIDGDHAGSTFTRWTDLDPFTITERDLLAVTLLDKRMSASIVRTLLEDETVTVKVENALRQLPLDARLENVDAELVLAMDDLYTTLRGLTPQPDGPYEDTWSTAAKLCGRKRPLLFPIRDEVICRYLGLWPSRYQVDWQVFYVILNDATVMDTLRRTIQRVAEAPRCDVGNPDHLLRHLDVAIWMHAPH